MMSAVERTPARERVAETNATLSSCCGVLGEITLTDSAVIILFAGMLGAGDMFALMTTSLLPLLNGIGVIPMAFLASRIGERKLIYRACAVSALAYFLAAAAPFFGSAAAAVLMGAILLFSGCVTGFIAGWFPMLDTFLTSERRPGFLSKMRFCHQLTATLFLFAVSCVIGKTPSLSALQGVLGVAGIIFIGRLLFITRIPVFVRTRQAQLGVRDGLRAAIGNRALPGFSIYMLVLNLAACGTIPLTTLYMKKYLQVPDNVIILISAITLSGMLAGYLLGGRMLKRLGVKKMLLLLHVTFVVTNLLLFFVGKGGWLTYGLIALLLFVYSFAVAASSIVSSCEMMGLSAPCHKTISLAFSGAFYYGGFGFSRLLTALLLGSGLLAPSWSLGTLKICHYQTLYLLYTGGVIFAAVFLLIVPAVFPKEEFAV